VVKDGYVLFDIRWLNVFNNDQICILEELKKDSKETMAKIGHHMDQFTLLGEETKDIDTTGAVNYFDNDSDDE
jgi:hypothetical protein